MRNLSLFLFTVFLLTSQVIGQNRIDASPKGPTVYGRVWFGSTPLTHAYVVVTDANITKIIGKCMTLPAGKDAGAYSIPGMPLNEPITVFAFSDNAPGILGFKETVFSDNSDKKLIIEIEINYSEIGMIDDPRNQDGGAGGILCLAGTVTRIITLILQADEKNEKESTISKLKRLLNESIGASSKKNSNTPEMVFVEGGNFMMGGNDGNLDEMPIRKVTVKSFYISKYEVTLKDYREFCYATGRDMPGFVFTENNGSFFDMYPVTFYDVINVEEYCKWAGGRLPTEEEWEYAAKGGKKSKGFKYSGSDNVDDVGWYGGNTDRRENLGVHPVGQKKPNELGIYDMSGNTWEWCRVISGEKISDVPLEYIHKGGSCLNTAEVCANTARGYSSCDGWVYLWGFRIVKD